ncbi:MAG TPA: ISL3 family transposase [Ktedonobacteraceae bacterium]|nr:ISL3 family transposase [Ktedonobacteraceae bacterium]
MPTNPLFPLPEGLELTSISGTTEEVLVRVTSRRTTSRCPLCSMPSSAVHSYYRRHPLDLPCTGRPIRLLLTVKKFFCRVASCPRKIFTERLPELIEPSSRLTRRLREAVQEIGFATCGKGGERLCSQLGMPISDASLLWSLFLVPISEVEKVRVVGIDDWSWRRGQRYGSILVDLETHKIIDLLPERTVESVVAWFETHPDVEIVSRDRGGTYVDGVTQGAPLATQVCDRWHILKNLGDAVEAFLVRTHVRLPESAPQDASSPTPSHEPPEPAAPLTTFSAIPRRQQHSQANLLRKWKLYQQAQELHTQGVGIIKIGKQLGLARNTVRKYLRQGSEPPQPTPRPLRTSLLDSYEEYLLKRWSQGCRNAAQLFREIEERGFQGSNTLVRAYIAHLRKTSDQATRPQSRKQRAAAVSPRELRWLLARKPEDLDEEEQARLHQLLNISEDVPKIYQLLQSFLAMIRNRKHQQLRSWMEEASRSEIAEMKSFVAGIERDYDAVKAALRLPWSQGVTEGKVNKLKTLKRQMYGRAGFALLRQRLLHDA